jgi:hypothetical protein
MVFGAEPTRPNPSGIVNVLGAAAQIPSDAIVIRGYLGRSNLLEQALSLLQRLAQPPTTAQGTPTPVLAAADIAAVTPVFQAVQNAPTTSALPWRIYLSPKLDCYVEFDWVPDLIAYKREWQADREDAYTVWLQRRPDSEPPYRVVDIQPLTPASGYVRGDLIEDYMTRAGTRGVWNEQDSALRGYTGKYCAR